MPRPAAISETASELRRFAAKERSLPMGQLPVSLQRRRLGCQRSAEAAVDDRPDLGAHPLQAFTILLGCMGKTIADRYSHEPLRLSRLSPRNRCVVFVFQQPFSG